MVQAMMAGVASIESQQTRMNVISNDLANINTTAFKGEDVNFADLISQQLAGASAPTANVGGTDGISYGLGVQVGSTSTNQSQGSLTATSVNSDLAIQGNGFFMTGNGSAISYTRDGSFTVDSTGTLVSADTGQKVLGWTADSLGAINTASTITATSSLTIPIGSQSAAQATENINLSGNLNSAAASTDSTTITTTVYDSQGTAHDVTLLFNNPTTTLSAGAPAGATSQWSWTAYSGDVASGTAIGSSTSTGNSPIYFNSSGMEVPATGGANAITVPATGGGTATVVKMDVSNVQELAGSDQITVTSQDGFPPGSLQGFTIAPDGVITGSFSNGLQESLGQIALASFSNPSALASLGANSFTTSANSGVPVVGVAKSGTLGSINSGFLEQSNVDLSTSLTNLIVTQRGFEANTKIISTVDELMQTLIEMKH